MKVNDILETKVINLDHLGRGVARVNEYVIFIPKTKENDVVKVEITKIKKNICEAVVISNINSLVRCEKFYECGGCHIMHLDYDEQLKYKIDKIKSIIRKYSNLKEEIITNITPSPNIYNYRNKVTFHVDKEIGFYEYKSNKLVPIDECHIANNKINQIINKITDINNISKLTIRTGINTNDVMLIVEGTLIQDDMNALREFVTSIYVKEDNKYTNIYGNDKLYEIIDNTVFMISPDSFFQVNTKQTENMYQYIKNSLNLNKKDTVLDLYCGVGTIGIYIAKDVKKVTGIEINSDAINDANNNAKINNIDNIDFICDDCTNISNNIIKNFNRVIVDPPRSGLTNKVIKFLNTNKFETIVYVSCDPMTLIRDIKLLENYTVDNIQLFDMFPHTYHVETVCTLKSK